jgi:hypothetical protein
MIGAGVYKDAIVTITLLHECAHLYKRLNRSTNVSSPQNSFIIYGESSPRKEDGFRFEKIMLAPGEGKLFKKAAIFVSKTESWSMTLEEFKREFSELQSDGEKNNESFIYFRNETRDFMEMPGCLRDPLLSL